MDKYWEIEKFQVKLNELKVFFWFENCYQGFSIFFVCKIKHPLDMIYEASEKKAKKLLIKLLSAFSFVLDKNVAYFDLIIMTVLYAISVCFYFFIIYC